MMMVVMMMMKYINQKPTKYTVYMEAHLINYFLINLLHISAQMGHSSCEEIACMAITIMQHVGD
jgi:hypothetical protein